MRRERIGEKLDAIVADPGAWWKIGQFVRDVAHELPRNRLDVLREIRKHIARRNLNETQNGNRDNMTAFLNGAMYAVVELSAAYGDSVEHEYRPKHDHFVGLGCFTCGEVASCNGVTIKDLLDLGMLESTNGWLVFVKHFPCCEKYSEPPKKDPETI